MKPRLEPIPDDGLVCVAGPTVAGRRTFVLMTPEQAHKRAAAIMAGFDNLSPIERAAWNYATTEFNGSEHVSRFTARKHRDRIKRIGATNLAGLL